MMDIRIIKEERNPTSKRVYDSVDYEVLLPSGKVARWSCIEGPDIAVVLAVDAERFAYMKKEWRLSQRHEVLELVSGRIDPGESAEQCAVRELKEEIGVEAANLIFLQKISLWNHATVHAHLFLATELTRGENKPDADEFLQLERVPYDTALEQASSAGTNAQTMLTLLLAKNYLG